MKLRAAIEICLISAGFVGWAVTSGELYQQSVRLRELNDENNAIRLDLTNEMVERCLTDNIMTIMINRSQRMSVPLADCSTQYAPSFTPYTAPGGSLREPTPTPGPVGRK